MRERYEPMAKIKWPARNIDLSSRERATVREAQQRNRASSMDAFLHWMDSQDPSNLQPVPETELTEPEPEPEPETTAEWLSRLP